MFLVVGLGNPGARYASTRHNIGFDVAAALAARWSLPEARSQYGCLLQDGQIAQQRALLAQPQKYMNLSGQPVASLMGYYKVPLDRVVVVHDEMGLPWAAVRARAGGGHGGHNGLRDLIAHIGAGFVRVRVGIGRPPKGWDPADFVLGRWSGEEQAALEGVVDTACTVVECILQEGLVIAQNRFHSPEPKNQQQ